MRTDKADIKAECCSGLKEESNKRIFKELLTSDLDFKTQLCLAEIGEHQGFEMVHIGEWNIDRNKRMLPTSHFKKTSRIETRMHNEYVLGFWKP